MNNQWNKDIHNRLKEFPKKAPKGLLNDIKSEMVRRGLSTTPVTSVQKHTTYPTVIRWIASIAATILILFSLNYLFQWKEPSIVSTNYENKILPIKDEATPTMSEKPDNQPISPILNRLIAKADKAKSIQADTLIIEKNTTTIKNDTIPEKPTEEAIPEKGPVTPTKHSRWANTPNKRKKSSFDIGFYYSGVIAQIAPASKGPYLTNPGPSENTTDSTATASRSVSRSFSRNKNNEKAKHHLPIRFGFSFRYNINKYWNIQSGLTYSYLASDLSNTNLNASYQTKQRLHYIGIPLQVGLRIWESKQFRTYISAGGQVEKLISGKATTHYMTDKQRPGSLIENISDKKLLFSALGSIGAEYMLGKNFSLYAEPSIHYYFKNRNGLQTYYNEQPLNFNITIGFRFHWKK